MTTEEWTDIIDHYKIRPGVCSQIKIIIKDKVCECYPSCCQICIDSLLEKRTLEVKTYSNAKIYISKEDPDGDKSTDSYQEETEVFKLIQLSYYDCTVRILRH